MSKKNKRHLTTKNTQPKKVKSFEATNKLTMPENPLEDFKWLPELTDSIEENLNIVNHLGFGIAMSGLNDSSEINYIPKLQRDESLLKEFINGKWRFMIGACIMRKIHPRQTIECKIGDLDIKRIDDALPEIRKRLKCRVWKSWDLNELQFFACDDDAMPEGAFHRIGWSIYPHIPYPEREVSND